MGLTLFCGTLVPDASRTTSNLSLWWKMKNLLVSALALCCGAALSAQNSPEKRVEVASLLKQLMVSTDQSSAKDSYLEMKSVFGKLSQATRADVLPNGASSFPKKWEDFLYIFHGRVTLLAKGRPLATDRMQDDAT